jgi:hypothetical protein
MDGSSNARFGKSETLVTDPERSLVEVVDISSYSDEREEDDVIDELLVVCCNSSMLSETKLTS